MFFFLGQVAKRVKFTFKVNKWVSEYLGFQPWTFKVNKWVFRVPTLNIYILCIVSTN